MDTRADCLSQQPSTLLVMLPGAQMALGDFWQQGFVAAVRSRGIAVDILAADINYVHVMAQTVVSTLHDEVIVPACLKGYRSIWLAGISLGGLNALLYAADHADRLAGIHLIAPYPGTGDICAEIRAAGGPRVWAKTAAANLGDERTAWRWLADQAATARRLPVSFGCGSEDRFVRNQRMFSELLPADAAYWSPGAHDWACWQHLWSSWLDDCPLPRTAGAPVT
jgi:pimeloyl-ACP methyl ester carboxylesterase